MLFQVFSFSQNTDVLDSTEPIDHSENKIITYFVNEGRPGALHFRVQQTHYLRRIPDNKERHKQWPTVCSLGILAAPMFVECWIGTLKVRSGLEQPR